MASIQREAALSGEPLVAVLVPCLNEEATVAKVVTDIRSALAAATIYVYDNGSDDDTRRCAEAAGAVVRQEPIRGKGAVVRRMFAEIEADVYLLVDGDDTYDAASAPALVEELVSQRLDMVNAARSRDMSGAYPLGHKFGNRLLTGIVAAIFGNRIRDMLSGYRAFSRRFVKSFPVASRGFEIETELTVHALELSLPIAEIETLYKERPDDSFSKLSTFKDGFRILGKILTLMKEEKPLPFFSTIALLLAVVAIVLAVPIVATYMETGLVPRFPTAILSTGLMVLAFLSLLGGVVLDTVTVGRKEMKRLHYLAVRPKAPRDPDEHR